jgi:hypothetical protein
MGLADGMNDEQQKSPTAQSGFHASYFLCFQTVTFGRDEVSATESKMDVTPLTQISGFIWGLPAVHGMHVYSVPY